VDSKQIRKAFEERGIRKVKIGGFDVDGILRGKVVTLDKFWSAMDKGFGFCDVIFGWDIGDVLYDNSTLTGWHTGYPDAPARIDPSSMRFLRYEPDTAHFLADFLGADGKPHPACPRNLLKRMIARAEASGYQPRFSAEFEFFVFQETPDTLAEKGFRDLSPLSPGMFGYSWVREGQHGDFLHDVLDTLADYGIPIEGIHTETGPGVYEAAIEYSDALLAADRGALFKTTMKQIARRHGLSVTFMAKWNADLPGCSGHLHQSLWDSNGEANLFADPAGEHGLSDLARAYVAGLVKLAPELTALYSPFVNTYKRYVPGVWAPLNATWGVENRTCAVRVINGPGKTAARAEYRQTASDINPYIAIATCLGAGLWGVEHRPPLPPPVGGDATAAGADHAPLPLTLAKAVEKLAESTAAREILGDAFVDHYVRTRDWEARQYATAVTDWELRRYFEAV
jgi:glutamine synthetase